MKFDKSKVYTALNADELKVGSRVIVASNIGDLKDRVAIHDDKYVTEIVTIEDEQTPFRFTIDATDAYVGEHWSLAYLVSEPVALEWTDLKIGDIVTNNDTLTSMVTAIDTGNDTGNDTGIHIYLANYGWTSNEKLAAFHKVGDLDYKLSDFTNSEEDNNGKDE